MRRFVLTGCVMGCVLAAGARGLSAEAPPFERARQLERAGEVKAAFLAYLDIPGCEYAAVRLARPKAGEFLPVVEPLTRDMEDTPANPRAILVRADLRLATGDKDGALKEYRAFVARIAEGQGQGWPQGRVPATYYPVEPSQPDHVYGPAQPFTLGPGSHRDNWLIRRFIALQAWDDAAREFERIRAIHRRMAQPYVLMFPVFKEGKVVSQEKRLVRPTGFSGRALQFAVDYAYFLKSRGRIDDSLAALMEPMALVDMDRNPNEFEAKEVIPEAEAAKYPDLTGAADSRLSARFAWSNGIARKEFVRLAYGAFKAAGKEDRLVRSLQRQIEDGRNAARRVLARVRLHQGRPDAALALELAYIEHGKFDDLSAAYRRGRAYEDCRKLADAAAEYEKAVALPFVTPDVPDADEEAVERRYMSARAVMPGEFGPPDEKRLTIELLARLERLYRALAKSDKVLDVTLRQFEASPVLLMDLDRVEQAAQRFRAVGAEARFTDWAKALAVKADQPIARANLWWVAGEYAQTAAAIGAAALPTTRPVHASYARGQWHDRFKKAGELRTLLEALVKANPNDGQARLELLALDGRGDTAREIQALELLLDHGGGHYPVRQDEADGRTWFRSHYHLAYRLMRLYERAGQLDELRALGLKMLKAFVGEWRQSRWQYRYRDANALPEDANAILGLTIQHADAGMLDDLEKALADWPNGAAKAQIARRKAGRFVRPVRKAIGWANMPDAVRAYVSHENVLSLAVDEKHIYAGMPWGIAVYTSAGEPVTRVALAADARDLLAVGDHLWAATSAGLCRISIGDWAVARLTLPAEEGRGSYIPYTLASDGKHVWIGTSRGVARFDPAANFLRVYSSRELRVTGSHGWERLLLDGDVVYADSAEGTRRYDPRTDTWAVIDCDERPVHLVALADGVLWGHVWLNDKLRDRPCRIDRRTGAVTPILIEQSARIGDRSINGPFAYFGTWKGKPVLGPKGPAYYYDATIDRLRPLPTDDDGRVAIDSDILPGLRSGTPWRKPNGVLTCYDDQTHKHEILQDVPFNTGNWSMARLADGALVLAGRRERCPRYPNDQESLFDTYETWTEEGGLYLIKPRDAAFQAAGDAGRMPALQKSTARRISSVLAADTLPGDEILALVRNAAGYDWVCTNRGLAVMDKDGAVVAHVTRADGLCANRVVGAAELGGKVYFATGWGDHGGGLAVFDPKTHVFTGRFRADGLATDKLANVAAGGDELVLKYDVEYMRSGRGEYRLYAPGRFDPKTGTVTQAGQVQMLRQPEASAMRLLGEPDRWSMRFLGGLRISAAAGGGQNCEAGSRGLLVSPVASSAATLKIAGLTPKVVIDPALALMAAAERVRPRFASAADLERYLADENLYLRRRALYFLAISNERSDPKYIPPVLKAADEDADPGVRNVAVYALTRLPEDKRIVKALEARLASENRTVRGLAAIDRTRRGHRPDLKHFAAIFTQPDRYGTLPMMRDTITVPMNPEAAARALIPEADAEVLALLVAHAPRVAGNLNPADWQALGQALRKHPEAAPTLLKTYITDGWQRDLILRMFKEAGPAMLPALHEALASPDRVTRSNAARACGAVGDPTSIPHLIQALDLESGLSRASIVWALGELKAAAAMPMLAKLYVDARNDEERRRGAGFRGAQSQAEIRAQYDTMASLDSVGDDWDELKAALAPEPVNPRRNEELLDPGHILDAVRKIGPAAAQDFYRALAGEKDTRARGEAAVGLAQGAKDDLHKNLVILRNLLGDAEVYVRIRAAVSLLLLGQDDARQPIFDWLKSDREWEVRQTLDQLARAKDRGKLAFARPQIEAIAADPAMSDDVRRLAKGLLER